MYVLRILIKIALWYSQEPISTGKAYITVQTYHMDLLSG